MGVPDTGNSSGAVKPRHPGWKNKAKTTLLRPQIENKQRLEQKEASNI